MKNSSKRQRNIDDARTNEAYRKRCAGVQIEMMDIGKVFAAGQAAIDRGANEQQLGDALVVFVETIRKN